MTISNIAAAINAAHAKVEKAQREGTAHALEAGRLLTEAKATVLHGRWDEWLREHCQFSPRTARLYMKVHRYAGADPAKRQRVADMSLREAAGEIAEPKRQTKLPTDGMPHLINMLAVWIEMPFTARKQFLDQLAQKGEITAEQYVGMLRDADKDAGPIRLIDNLERDFGRDSLVALNDAVITLGMPAPTSALFKRIMKERGVRQ